MTVDHALKYLKRGFSIVPMRGKPYSGSGSEEERLKNSKAPLVAWTEFQRRMPTEKEVRDWYVKWPNANLALITGMISGIVVADLDSEDAVERAKGMNILNTPLVKSRRGIHAYFKYPFGMRISNSVDKQLATDIRAEGGNIIAPPSVHFSGHKYEWIEGHSLDDIQLMKLPDIFIEAEKKKAAVENRSNGMRDLYTGTAQNYRNYSLTRLCGSWVNDGLTIEECLEMAQIWNTKNSPPMDEKEMRKTVESIFRRHHRNDRRRALMYHEANLLKMPLFPIETRESLSIENTSENKKRNWTITGAASNLPGPADEAVFLAIHQLIASTGKPLRSPFHMGNLDEVLALLGKEKNTETVRETIESVRKITSLRVTADNAMKSDSKTFKVEDTFGIYERCISRGLLEEPEKTSLTIWLNEVYMKNIDEYPALPFDFKTYLAINDPVARGIYKLVAPIFKENDYSTTVLKYGTICKRLQITEETAYADICKQLEQAHTLMKIFGIIASASITKNKTCFVVQYKPQKKRPG